MSSMDTAPVLTKRAEPHGWLASAPPGHSLRFTVAGETEEEAVANFEAARERWEALRKRWEALDDVDDVADDASVYR